MTLALQGIGITSPRPVALGPAFVERRRHGGIAPSSIDPDRVETEIARFETAVAAARDSLHAARLHIPRETPLIVADFIDTHLLMLNDVALLDAVRIIIAERLCSAEWALQMQCEILAAAFEAIEDPYLRSRRDDIEQVVLQIQTFLQGRRPASGLTAAQLEGRVVVAHDLTPADAIVLRQHGAVAFVTEHGGPMSHTAILARGLGIPAVVGVHQATRYLRQGEFLAVDGESGTVLADADARTLEYFRQRLRAIERRQRSLRALVGRPSLTRDGASVKLLANLELPEDTAVARANGAAGIGLYRTEFLYMNRPAPPDEEEHLASYAAMIAELDGIPLTIRTLDLGGDKVFGGLDPDRSLGRSEGASASGQVLGLRAIRLCLKEPELFRPQLRAILRASALGPVRLMLPLVTSVREVERTLDLLAQMRAQLDREGLGYDPDLPVGAMIEVPAAALTARAIARRLDFLSIGTNDLIQYTLAIDRLDDAVNDLYDPAHPAILRLIRMTLEAGRAEGLPVAMCGEMAGDPHFTRLLLGMGLREFSMQPGALLDIKEIVLEADTRQLRESSDWLFAHLDEEEPAALIERLNRIR